MQLQKSVNEVDADDTDDENQPVFYINNVDEFNPEKMWLEVRLNNEFMKMELDSGSAVSIISYVDYKKHLNNVKLIPTPIRLKSYTDNDLNVLGKLQVTVTLEEESNELPLYVISGNKTPLFGREWIRGFSADTLSKMFHTVNAVQVSNTAQSVTGTESVLKKLLGKYSVLFDKQIGEMKGEPVSINLKANANIPFFRARPVPFAIKKLVEDEIDNLVREGVLEKIDYSDYATPIVPVVKSGNKIRLCADFKVTLNPNLVVDEHPLPTTDELFQDLAGGEKFTKIDLTKAYLQMRVRDEDQKFLTLNTHKGLYKCTRLMYGLSCAPAKFQRKIENILSGIPGIAVFIDDCRLTAPNDKIHLERLEEVFKRLLNYNIKVNLSKSEFLKNEIEYCGYRIDKFGIHKTKSKVDMVVNALQPKNIQELQSLLGLINYYGRFFENLSEILEPMRLLLREGVKWNWTKACENALNKIKEMMKSDNFLVHFNNNLQIILATDASPVGVGAVLSHIMPDGSEKPIQFASQSLTSSQRNWSQIDKEAYAIIFGVKRFHQFLFGRKFVLYTDHAPLAQIFSPQKGLPIMSASRMQHYAIFLQSFNFEIRLPVESKIENTVEESDIYEISQIHTLPVTVDELSKQTKLDTELGLLLTMLKENNNVPHLVRFGINQSEFTIQNDCILRGNRVVIPSILRKRILKDLHCAHFGIARMLSLARSVCWWPGIDEDIKAVVQNCLTCAENKNNPPEIKHHWVYPSSPFDRVHVDFAGPFLNVYFLILIDAYSKWPEVHILHKINTDNTIEILRRIFSIFGIPNCLCTDNGVQFVNPKFELFLKSQNIVHKRSAPYHPATNGQVERTTLSLMLPKPVERSFEVGDRIAARNYLGPLKWKFGRVTKKLGLLHYEITLDDGLVWRRHINQLSNCGENLERQLPCDYRNHEIINPPESKPDPIVNPEVRQEEIHPAETSDNAVISEPSVSVVPNLRRSKRTPKPIDKLNL
ncbi:uncharacterized protein K02A2.6-like [Photinus pyralis]|uniref:uncharacterized protein K02A2.6-like n=1 Tax=Photinus pyralis TaxID=7054 RepID=UPI0012673128|nr:uncharacterized protein K02A2.6-like [Photinus pyralis]